MYPAEKQRDDDGGEPTTVHFAERVVQARRGVLCARRERDDVFCVFRCELLFFDGLLRTAGDFVVGVVLVSARRAGWDELTDYLENGYRAFKHMRGARHFLDTVREREQHILDRIYAGDPDPFGFNESVS